MLVYGKSGPVDLIVVLLLNCQHAWRVDRHAD